MKIIDCEQGKQEWWEARCGRLTASEIADALRKNVKGPLKDITSAGRENLMAFLVGEILTGQPDMMGYSSDYMNRGTLLEPDARRAYERQGGVMVEEVGFIVHPLIERSGASPDGLVTGKRRGLEIKVPGIAKHIRWMRDGIMPEEHIDQVQWNIDCAEYDEWDFVSYCPTMPSGMQLFRKLVPRDDVKIAIMRAGVEEFLADADRLLALLKDRYPLLTALKASLTLPDDMEGLGLGDAELNDECFTTVADMDEVNHNAWFETRD